MALIPDSYKTGGAFFHSISKTITETSQYPFESNYKSGHTVTLKDVFGDEIPYAGDAVTADLNVTNNPTIIKKYTQYSLTEVPGSNQQAWKIVFAGNDVKSLISAVDVLNPINATPSFGYEPKLYTQGSVFIPPTTGAWWIDFYSGIVHFANGFTPNLLGWGVPKLTVYAYIGRSLGNVISTLGAALYRGLWNPTTNVPTIATGSANDGNLGNYYICSEDGNTTVDGTNNWKKGQWIISNAAVWEKFDISGAVNKNTLLTIDVETPALTPLSLITSGAFHTKTLDDGNVGTSALLFQTTEKIKVYRNGILLNKSTDVTWDTTTALTFPYILRVGEEILILS